MNREPKHGIGNAKTNRGSFDRLSRHAGSVYQVNRSHGASAKHLAETRITPAMVGISIVATFCVIAGAAFGVSTFFNNRPADITVASTTSPSPQPTAASSKPAIAESAGVKNSATSAQDTDASGDYGTSQNSGQGSGVKGGTNSGGQSGPSQNEVNNSSQGNVSDSGASDPGASGDSHGGLNGGEDADDGSDGGDKDSEGGPTNQQPGNKNPGASTPNGNDKFGDNETGYGEIVG